MITEAEGESVPPATIGSEPAKPTTHHHLPAIYSGLTALLVPYNEGMNSATVELLYQSHFSALVREVTSVTCSPSASEDLVQNCFAKLLASESEPDAPWPYLRRMITNATRDWMRRQQFERKTFTSLEEMQEREERDAEQE